MRGPREAEAVAVGKVGERSPFDRPATQEAFEAGIVQDFAVAGINTMVNIAPPVRFQMRAKRNVRGDCCKALCMSDVVVVAHRFPLVDSWRCSLLIWGAGFWPGASTPVSRLCLSYA